MITNLKLIFSVSSQSNYPLLDGYFHAPPCDQAVYQQSSPTTLLIAYRILYYITEKMEMVTRDIFHPLAIKLGSLMQCHLILPSAVSFMKVVCSGFLLTLFLCP